MPQSRSRIKKSTGRPASGAGRRTRSAPRPALSRPEPRVEKVRHARRGEPTYFRVTVTLAGSTPSIWRRLDLANDLTLVEVHRVLQSAFDWYDGHLHQFVTDAAFPERFIDTRMNAGPDTTPEDDVRLDEVLAGPGGQLLYEYDFGDSWEHLLEVESEHARPVDAPRARVLDSARAAPPEDCGGIFRYEYLIQHLDDPEVAEELPFDFPEDPDYIDTDDLDEAVRLALTPAP